MSFDAAYLRFYSNMSDFEVVVYIDEDNDFDTIADEDNIEPFLKNLSKENQKDSEGTIFQKLEKIKDHPECHSYLYLPAGDDMEDLIYPRLTDYKLAKDEIVWNRLFTLVQLKIDKHNDFIAGKQYENTSWLNPYWLYTRYKYAGNSNFNKGVNCAKRTKGIHKAIS